MRRVVEKYKLEARFFALGSPIVVKAIHEKLFDFEGTRSNAIEKAAEFIPAIVKDLCGLTFSSGWILLMRHSGAPLWSWTVDAQGGVVEQQCEYAP
ncbi:MAG: hypothetical protein AAB461_01700 [Patescibacteria group bacterium]